MNYNYNNIPSNNYKDFIENKINDIKYTVNSMNINLYKNNNTVRLFNNKIKYLKNKVFYKNNLCSDNKNNLNINNSNSFKLIEENKNTINFLKNEIDMLKKNIDYLNEENIYLKQILNNNLKNDLSFNNNINIDTNYINILVNLKDILKVASIKDILPKIKYDLSILSINKMKQELFDKLQILYKNYETKDIEFESFDQNKQVKKLWNWLKLIVKGKYKHDYNISTSKSYINGNNSLYNSTKFKSSIELIGKLMDTFQIKELKDFEEYIINLSYKHNIVKEE